MQPHPENFPVASWWLPFKTKKAIKLIYQFARAGDDIVDEGNNPVAIRSEQLALLETAFLLGPDAHLPWIRELAQVIQIHKLPLLPFLQLLAGFRQDLSVNRYQTFEDLFQYCQMVAHPIGHLWLCLMKHDTPENRILSDNLSTALQLLDTIQDIHLDYTEQNRLYMPQENWDTCGFEENQLTQISTPEPVLELLSIQQKHAEYYLEQSLKAPHTITGLAGLQVRLCQAACKKLLQRCRQRTNHNIIPRLKKRDWVVLLLTCLVHMN